MMNPRPRRPLLSFLSFVVAATPLAVWPVAADADVAGCLDAAALPRVARVRAPDGGSVYARVWEHEDGIPTGVSPIADADVPLREVFDRAASLPPSPPDEIWRIAEDEGARICSPVRLPQAAIDAETHVVVAAGLNYAAHAEEAGGGEVFLFPKPVEPSAPYGVVAPPAGVTLLDYEVELAYVLLVDIDLSQRPSRETFLASTAFFVANDITDREAIIRHIGFSPPGSGFVEAKGQPGFMPAGPWMVRGSELFEALARCGETGLGIHLEVDEGDGFATRQAATTALMIVKPLELIEQIAQQIETAGLRTDMPVERPDGTRFYPFAVEREPGRGPVLPAGSLVVTGTPAGVAMQAPGVGGLVLRGLVHLRGPIEQLRQEEIARAEADAPGGYLAPGDRVRAGIDGLGTQILRIEAPGSPLPRDACD